MTSMPQYYPANNAHYDSMMLLEHRLAELEQEESRRPSPSTALPLMHAPVDNSLFSLLSASSFHHQDPAVRHNRQNQAPMPSQGPPTTAPRRRQPISRAKLISILKEATDLLNDVPPS